MTEWPLDGLEDDMLPRIHALAESGRALTLATVTAAERGGPRGVGAQMVVAASGAWGFLSGGCVEADVRIHALQTLDTGEPKRLVYGEGSPFFDVRLLCGGRLDVLIERIVPSDPVCASFAYALKHRVPLFYRSDGETRIAHLDKQGFMKVAPGAVQRIYWPSQRLVVIGWDPFALAIAAMGRRLDWDVTVVRPWGPANGPPLDVAYSAECAGDAIESLAPDVWTAVACVTHDLDVDNEALAAALRLGAGYVGVLGSRRLLPERLEKLRAAGVGEARLGDLRAPIGLMRDTRAPWHVAVSVVAQIIAERAARQAS